MPCRWKTIGIKNYRVTYDDIVCATDVKVCPYGGPTLTRDVDENCIFPLCPIVAAPVNHVCLYVEEDFQGERLCFEGSTAGDLCDDAFGGCDGAWNEKIVSIQFGQDIQGVQLYRHGDFNQLSTTLTSETTSLEVQYRDVTSIKVLQAVDDDQVCMYVQEDFQGDRKCFSIRSENDLCHDSNGGCDGYWNDHIQSIQFGASASSVEIFQHSDYKDFYTTFVNEQLSVPNEYRDFTSFRVIQDAPVDHVCMYKKYHYMGDRKCFEKGAEANLCDSKYGGCHEKWDHHVRSIQGITSEMKVLVYKRKNFRRYLVEYKAETRHMNWWERWHHGFTSLRVQDQNKVCMYQSYYYQGVQKCFEKGDHNLCDSQNGGCNGQWNDGIRSIYKGDYVQKIDFYKHSNFEGFIKTITGSKRKLWIFTRLRGLTSFRIF